MIRTFYFVVLKNTHLYVCTHRQCWLLYPQWQWFWL